MKVSAYIEQPFRRLTRVVGKVKARPGQIVVDFETGLAVMGLIQLVVVSSNQNAPQVGKLLEKINQPHPLGIHAAVKEVAEKNNFLARKAGKHCGEIPVILLLNPAVDGDAFGGEVCSLACMHISDDKRVAVSGEHCARCVQYYRRLLQFHFSDCSWGILNLAHVVLFFEANEANNPI